MANEPYAPDLFATLEIESDRGAALAADKADQFVSLQQWVPGKAPHRRFKPILPGEIVRPDELSIRGFQT